ncbi:MAG: methylated-DNA--[protein]-cysteine S-methyltransferase [Elusimicrobiales bacterium]
MTRRVEQLLYGVADSPVGKILIVVSGKDNRLVLLHYPLASSPEAVFNSHFRFECAPSEEAVARIKKQLRLYFSGRLREFDLPLDLRGTPFQMRVWKELLKIPFGQTITYGELARRIGQPRAARAVGMANNKNRIGIVVPCHRVIGAGGALTGYAAGTGIKKKLLEHESAI